MRQRFGQRSAVLSGSVVLVLWTAGLASAQMRPDQAQRMRWQQQQHQQQQQQQQQAFNRQMQQANQLTLKLSGTVEMAAAGGLQVVNANGEAWRLRLTPNAKVELRGPTSPDSLAAGQYVRFTAKVDIRHSKVDEPLTKLTICTADAQNRPGAGGEGELAKGPNRAASPGAKSAGRTPPATEETLEIMGRIASLKGNKMTVAVPNAPFKSALRVELADQVTVDFDLRGAEALSLIQRGDKIEAGGAQLGDHAAQIAELKVDIAAPSDGGEKEKRVRRGARSKTNAEEAETPAEK